VAGPATWRGLDPPRAQLHRTATLRSRVHKSLAFRCQGPGHPFRQELTASGDSATGDQRR
jgi:hypothetical protein